MQRRRNLNSISLFGTHDSESTMLCRMKEKNMLCFDTLSHPGFIVEIVHHLRGETDQM